MMDPYVLDEIKRINIAGISEVSSEFEQAVYREIIDWMLKTDIDLSQLTKAEIYETFWEEKLS